MSDMNPPLNPVLADLLKTAHDAGWKGHPWTVIHQRGWRRAIHVWLDVTYCSVDVYELKGEFEPEQGQGFELRVMRGGYWNHRGEVTFKQEFKDVDELKEQFRLALVAGAIPAEVDQTAPDQK